MGLFHAVGICARLTGDERFDTLAMRTGKSITEALNDSLDLSLFRQRMQQRVASADELFRKVREIQEQVSRLPILDLRTADEIIGYNEHGHFD
jgi:antitoxin VapB